MNQLDPIVAAGIVITLAAIFAYANERWLQFPETIGLMVVAMIITLLLVLVGVLNPRMVELAREFVEQIDFNATLMHGMLGFLLFAGALHVKLDDLAEQKWVVTITATFGVIGSGFLRTIFFWRSVFQCLGSTACCLGHSSLPPIPFQFSAL